MSETRSHIDKKPNKQPNYNLRRAGATVVAALTLAGTGLAAKAGVEAVGHNLREKGTEAPVPGNPPYAEEMARRGLYGNNGQPMETIPAHGSSEMSGSVKKESGEVVNYVVMYGDDPTSLAQKYGDGSPEEIQSIVGQEKNGVLQAGQGIELTGKMAEKYKETLGSQP